MATPTDRDDAVQKLAAMIKDIEVAMLTTVDADGTLRSRPMITQKTDFDGDLWFFTHADAPKVDEVRRAEKINLSYAAPDKQRYVSVSGTARLVRDRAQAEQLWHPFLRAWFPDGLDDPNLGLLKVSVERAEYWDSPSSSVVHLVGFVKALASGQSYKPGENEKVDLASD